MLIIHKIKIFTAFFDVYKLFLIFICLINKQHISIIIIAIIIINYYVKFIYIYLM